jgi:hypothetical protein
MQMPAATRLTTATRVRRSCARNDRLTLEGIEQCFAKAAIGKVAIGQLEDWVLCLGNNGCRGTTPIGDVGDVSLINRRFHNPQPRLVLRQL